MPNNYYKTIAALEKKGIARDYILGWASGFLGTPKLEEQRVTKPYEAGYGDGKKKTTANAKNWKAGEDSASDSASPS